MKKLMALLLMLCMLVAAVPALGEDYSGTWYLNMGRVTVGTMELNADGTGTMNAAAVFGDPIELAWEAGENAVNITIAGDTGVFPYDGTQLAFPGYPIVFNREAGVITFEQMQNYMTTQELPEGVTAEDMMAIAMEIQELQNSVYESLPEENSGETPAASEGEPVTEDAALVVSILKENMILVKDSYSEKLRAFYFAEIQNNTQTAYSVNKGLFNLLDADGNVVAEETYFQSNGSSYLEPGETSFACFRVDVPEGVENPTYKASFEAQVNDWARKDLAVNVTGTEIGKDRYDRTVMRVTVENNQEGNLIDLRTVAALEDVDGNLIWVTQGYLNNAELLPGNSIVLLVNIDSDADAYFAENNISPAKVEAYAYEEIRD